MNRQEFQQLIQSIESDSFMSSNNWKNVSIDLSEQELESIEIKRSITLMPPSTTQRRS